MTVSKLKSTNEWNVKRVTQITKNTGQYNRAHQPPAPKYMYIRYLHTYIDKRSNEQYIAQTLRFDCVPKCGGVKNYINTCRFTEIWV